MSSTTVTNVTSVNDIPDELLRLISISGGPTEYCNFRRAMRRVWEYTTGREDHCIKHFLVTEVDEDGDTVTTLCGKCHSMFDQPAIRQSDGAQIWYQRDEVHRDNDLPAVIYSDGDKEWYQHGKIHRDNDLPARIYPDGTRWWYQHGKRHRYHDQPAYIGADGVQSWWSYGKHLRYHEQSTYTPCQKKRIGAT